MYFNTILPVVLYGCEAWSLTAREERKLRVFEDMVLRRIFGPRRDDGPPLWSSGQSFGLQIQRSRVRFPALPDFLSSSGSGTGSTQPREVK